MATELTPLSVIPVPAHLTTTEGRVFDGNPLAALDMAPPSLPVVLPVAVQNQVCATVGVFSPDEKVMGAVLAQGAAGVQHRTTADGDYIEVLLAWPAVRAWGYGQCDFLKQSARNRCVARYAAEAEALVEKARRDAPHATVVLSFTGEWNEETHPLRRRMAGRFVNAMFPS